MSGFMRDSDAFAWYMENDPTLRSTVVAIAWLESAPDWDALVAKVDRAARLIPNFRERVCEPPFRLATPRWTVDETFDLMRHVHRVDASVLHDSHPVMTIARTAAIEGFDRSRPLWDFTLVEQLEGGRAALVMKLHHSLTDGIGGIQLAMLLFDLEASPAPSASEPDHRNGDGISDDLILLSLARGGERVVDLMTRAAGSVLPMTSHVARHPMASVDSAVETVQSIGRMVAPVTETMSPIMKGRSVGRHLDMLEVQLDDLHRAAAAAGGTINDAFMAALTGGLRRYHERHATPVENLRVTLPISIRKPKDPMGGNRITLIRFAVPVAERDPATRIRELDRLCRDARHERSLHFTDAIAATLNVLPQQVIAGMLKHIDFVASNVPGFTSPAYLVGARVEGIVSFGPTTGTAANFTLVSHDGICCVGVNIDTAAVLDPDVLVECVREGFEEVLSLAGDHDGVQLVRRDEPSRSARPAKHVARKTTKRSSGPARKERQWTT